MKTVIDEITSTTKDRSLIVQTSEVCVIAHHQPNGCCIIEREGQDVYFVALVGGPGAWTQTDRQELAPGSRWVEVPMDKSRGWHELKWNVV
jgi:hypothetical protein